MMGLFPLLAFAGAAVMAYAGRWVMVDESIIEAIETLGPVDVDDTGAIRPEHIVAALTRVAKSLRTLNTALEAAARTSERRRFQAEARERSARAAATQREEKLEAELSAARTEIRELTAKLEARPVTKRRARA